MNEPYSSFRKRSVSARGIRWLTPSEAGPDDGLLIWALKKQNPLDLPYEIRESTVQDCGTFSGLRLSVIDHQQGTYIGELGFKTLSNSEFEITLLEGSTTTARLAILTRETIRVEPQYLRELQEKELRLEKNSSPRLIKSQPSVEIEAQDSSSQNRPISFRDAARRL